MEENNQSERAGSPEENRHTAVGPPQNVVYVDAHNTTNQVVATTQSTDQTTSTTTSAVKVIPDANVPVANQVANSDVEPYGDITHRWKYGPERTTIKERIRKDKKDKRKKTKEEEHDAKMQENDKRTPFGRQFILQTDHVDLKTFFENEMKVNRVFRLLYLMVGDHNTKISGSRIFHTLIHPLFITENYDLGKHTGRTLEFALKEYTSFPSSNLARRILLPIYRNEHFALAVFGLDSQKDNKLFVRVQIMDPKIEDSNKMLTDNEAKKLAMHFFMKTGKIERGTEKQVQRQQGERDCEVLININTKRYLDYEEPYLEHIGTIMNLKPTDQYPNIEERRETSEQMLQKLIDMDQQCAEKGLEEEHKSGQSSPSTSDPSDAIHYIRTNQRSQRETKKTDFLQLKQKLSDQKKKGPLAPEYYLKKPGGGYDKLNRSKETGTVRISVDKLVATSEHMTGHFGDVHDPTLTRSRTSQQTKFSHLDVVDMQKKPKKTDALKCKKKIKSSPGGSPSSSSVKYDSDDDSKKATDTGKNIQITSITRSRTQSTASISKEERRNKKSADKLNSQALAPNKDGSPNVDGIQQSKKRLRPLNDSPSNSTTPRKTSERDLKKSPMSPDSCMVPALRPYASLPARKSSHLKTVQAMKPIDVSKSKVDHQQVSPQISFVQRFPIAQLPPSEPMKGVQTSTETSAVPPATIEQFDKEAFRNSFFMIWEKDLEETKFKRKMINSNVVFLMLYHAIEAIYANSTIPLALMHPDFFGRLSDPEWVNLQEIIIDAHISFADSQRPKRVIMPILRYRHFVLTVFDRESSNHVRVHVKDSLHGNIISTEEIEQFAKRYYNNNSITVTVEQGSPLQVERQKDGSNDCGIMVILNALPYLPMRCDEPLGSMKDLENPTVETDTNYHRKEIAQILKDRYVNKKKSSDYSPASPSSSTITSNDTNYKHWLSEDVSSRPIHKTKSPPTHAFVENKTEKLENISKRKNSFDKKDQAKRQKHDFFEDFFTAFQAMKLVPKKKNSFWTSWITKVEAVESDNEPENRRELVEKIHKTFTREIHDTKNEHFAKQLLSMYERVRKILNEIEDVKGFCCGKTYMSSLPTIICTGSEYQNDTCRVEEGEPYYFGVEKDGENEWDINFCESHYKQAKNGKKCFASLNKTMLEHLKKQNHVKQPEVLIPCKKCGRMWHLICANIAEDDKDDFICIKCDKVPTNNKQVSSKFLVQTSMSRYVQRRMNDTLKKEGEAFNDLKVRVFSSVRKVGKWDSLNKKLSKCNFPYTQKFIAVLQEVGGKEVMLFGMVVQEYEQKSKEGWIFIQWLDSVRYFKPDKLRGVVSRSFLFSYFEYAARTGKRNLHIWASAPEEKGDFLFNIHPLHQKYLTQEELENWYSSLLKEERKEDEDKVIEPIQEEFINIKNTSMEEVFEYLYFDGGFWPTVFDERQLFNVKSKVYLKKEIEKVFLESKSRLFYAKLRNQPEEEDKDEPIHSELAKNRQAWIEELMEHNWNFGSLREAQYATQMIIKRLMKERENKTVPKKDHQSSSGSEH